MLSDRTIRKLALNQGMIQPFYSDNLSPASYDLSLDKNDRAQNVIPAHSAKLVVTREAVSLPAYVGAKIVSKSSISRLKVSVGDIGGWVDPGYQGQLTLLAINFSDEDIDLNQFHTVCQIVFFDADLESENPYNGHYQNSYGLQEAWFGKDEKGENWF